MFRTLTASSSRALLAHRPAVLAIRQPRRYYTENSTTSTSETKQSTQEGVSEVRAEVRASLLVLLAVLLTPRQAQVQEGWLWVDSVFPVSLGIFE